MVLERRGRKECFSGTQWFKQLLNKTRWERLSREAPHDVRGVVSNPNPGVHTLSAFDEQSLAKKGGEEAARDSMIMAWNSV